MIVHVGKSDKTSLFPTCVCVCARARACVCQLKGKAPLSSNEVKQRFRKRGLILSASYSQHIRGGQLYPLAAYTAISLLPKMDKHLFPFLGRLTLYLKGTGVTRNLNDFYNCNKTTL